MPGIVKHNIVNNILDSYGLITTAPSVFILGTAIDGPVNEPIKITNLQAAISKFGEGELIKAAHEALFVENANIYLVRISGKNAQVSVLNTQNEEVIHGITGYAGRKYNKYFIAIDSSSIKIGYINVDSTITEIISYNKADFLTLGEFQDKINEDYYENKHLIFIDECERDANITTLKTQNAIFSGGADESSLSIKKRSEYISETCDLLNSIPSRAAVVVPLGLYYDSTDDSSYLRSFGEWCEERSESGYCTIGIFGIEDTSFNNLINIYNYKSKYCCAIAAKVKLPILELPYYEASSIDNGVNFIANASVIYGALISAQVIPYSLTNVEFPCIEDTLPEWTTAQLIALEIRGITCLKKSTRRGYVISSAVTLYQETPYGDLQTIRAVGELSSSIREYLEPYIGEPFPQDTLLYENLDGILKYLIATKTFRGYKMNISKLMHELIIAVEVVPIGEIKSIETNLRFTFSGWE